MILKKAVETADSLGNANFAPSNDQVYSTQMVIAKFAFPRLVRLVLRLTKEIDCFFGLAKTATAVFRITYGKG